MRSQGEPDFEALVEKHADYVYNVAYRVLGNAPDAEDATQEAFLSVYRSLGRFRGDSEIRTWLYRISMNAALMLLRRDRLRKYTTGEGYDDLRLVSLEPGPEGSAINTELKDKLAEGLALLPPSLRTAVVLRDVEGMSNEEASRVLRTSISSLKARLHRGRVILRKYLADHLADRQ